MIAGTGNFDVVVAGTGAGGLTGALRAASHGLRVLVLEKAPVVGGTAALTGGGLWAPTNHWLDEAGIDDSLERASTYLDHAVGDRTSKALRETYLRAAVATLDWLGEQGLRMGWMPGFPDYHPDLPGGALTGRAIRPKPVAPEDAARLVHPVRPPLALGDGGPAIRATDTRGRLWGGQALIAQLLLMCQEAGVEIRTSTPLTGLLVEGDRVVGVSAGGIEIACPAGVLLATGGFEHSPELRAAWQLPAVQHGNWSLGVEGNTGDGLRAGLALGAATDLLEDAWWTPAVIRPDGGVSFLLWERTAPMGFIVDQSGQRWLNEGLPYNSFGQAMRSGGPAVVPSWQVFDQQMFDRYGYAGLAPGEDLTSWLAAGCLVRADSLAELASLTGAAGLVQAAERWNTLAHRGIDEDFGRGGEGSFERQLLTTFAAYPGIVGPPEHLINPSLAPLGDGPYYAAPVVLGDLGTKGGLVCDDRARVLREDGSVIPGLYACGNTMASVMGHAYPGPGSCITPGMAFAWLAADDLAGR